MVSEATNYGHYSECPSSVRRLHRRRVRRTVRAGRLRPGRYRGPEQRRAAAHARVPSWCDRGDHPGGRTRRDAVQRRLAQNTPIHTLVLDYAWGGLGAAIGPPLIVSLWWKRITAKGSVASMIVGALTMIV
nr:hypothetical protein [Haloterrigena gelatinilytica]